MGNMLSVLLYAILLAARVTLDHPRLFKVLIKGKMDALVESSTHLYYSNETLS